MTRRLISLGILLAATTAARPQDAGGPSPPRLTHKRLGEMLTKLGFEPKERRNDYYHISIARDKLTFTYVVRHLDRRGVILLDTKLGDLPDNEQAPPLALRRLLEENEALGPTMFIYVKAEKAIYLAHPVEDRDLTSARLRKEIEIFNGLARKAYKLARGDNFVKLWGVPEEAANAGLAALRGEWQVMDFWTGGKLTPRGTLKKINFRAVINGTKLSWVSSQGAAVKKDDWTIAADPRRDPKAIDLINKDGQVQAAIYTLEGDTLTVVAAIDTGLPRPADFEAGKKSVKIVLKRIGGQP
jgi:uncharacterized protein (TIGR03067 family)